MTSPRPRMVPFEPSHLWDRFITRLAERARPPMRSVAERDLIAREVRWWLGFAAIQLAILMAAATGAARLWK